jgi:hypothetical protein
MSVLNNSKHEQFAQLIAKGVNATKAYVSAGYSGNGARGGAARLNAKATVCARIRELQKTLSAGTIALEITSRNARVTALQTRWDRLRAGLELILQQRGADMADVPGGASGLLVRDYKGKEADRLVTRIDPGVVSLLAELRGHERQAAEELEQWKTHVEEHKVIDASPAEITLAMVCSRVHLLEMKRKALELQQQEPAA